MKQETFFQRNKVFIIGALSAVALALHELFSAGEASVKVLVFAGLLAAASYFAKNLRGQWASIAGLVGTALTTYVTMEQTGTLSWGQLILQVVIGYLAIVSSPAKSLGYERTGTIESAKHQGEAQLPSVAKP